MGPADCVARQCVIARAPASFVLLAGDRAYGATMPVESRQNGLGARLRSVAVVIWFLSRKCDLAGFYAWSCKHDVFGCEDGMPEEQILALTLFAWWRQRDVKKIVEAAMDDPNHRSRLLADEFLVRSLVAEFIFAQNARNQSVQPAAIIARYLRYWSYRSVPAALADKLVRLTHNMMDRKNFLRRFRQEWSVRPGPLLPDRGLTRQATTGSVDTVT